MYIVGQVISKIAITGHHPRIISDDVARHIERGARLLCLFTKEGTLVASSVKTISPREGRQEHWSLLLYAKRVETGWPATVLFNIVADMLDVLIARAKKDG